MYATKYHYVASLNQYNMLMQISEYYALSILSPPTPSMGSYLSAHVLHPGQCQLSQVSVLDS